MLVWLLILGLLGVVVWMVRKVDALAARITTLENQINFLNKVVATKLAAAYKAAGSPEAAPAPPPQAPVSPKATPTAPIQPPPPPLAAESEDRIKPSPPSPAATRTQPEAPPLRPSLPAFNWERFMGVKLLAWVGGLALFLGLAFFVKYSFEHNFITPEMRVAIGFMAGAGLLAGGLLMSRKGYAVLGQSLAATGILALYASTFAAHAFYRFIGFIPTFALMILITVTAFLLSVRLEAQVVAVLGLLGGFLTPIVLSTGKDNPLGLFGYISLLDLGLIAVVRRTRWTHLVLLAALGTLGMQCAWVGKFFAVEKTFTAILIFLTMEALFLAAFVLAQKRDEEDHWITEAAFLEALAPLVFAFYLLGYPTLAGKPWIIFGFALFADLGLLSLALWRPRLAAVHLLGGLLFFLLLAHWTLFYLTAPLLNWALGWYFVFAVLHSCFPIILERRRPGVMPWWWGLIFPGLAFALVLLPILLLPALPITVWFFVLLLNGLIFGLALTIGCLEAILGALVLTIAALACWILRLPGPSGAMSELVIVIGGFAVLFFAAGIFALRRPWAPAEARGKLSAELFRVMPNLPAQLPALSAILPFLLLVLVVLRLPLTNPSPIFGLALILIVLILGLGRALAMDWLMAIGLASTLMLEYVWHGACFKPDFALAPLLWYLTFYAVFTLFPFLFRRSLASRALPWVVAALSGPLHFALIYRLADTAYRNPYMGLLPAAFALPSLLGLFWIIRHFQTGEEMRNQLLAWWGGAALFFITLIFPIQFEKEWITISWALEGVALLWLFHRVPHPGLKMVGVALLGVAFVRLALNPAVLAYHPRSAIPLLNRHLYAYGITTACLLAGARLLRPPHHIIRDVNVLPWLNGMGGILAFLLLNIEIADYFSTGSTLTFQFHGNFARDMTYSLAWALFALGLLVFGVWKKRPAPRYASLGLLAVTLLKLFLHDLARLDAIYRIGAFIGVAIVLLLGSFIYQRFLSREGEPQ